MDIIKKIAAIILAAALCLGSAALAEETPGVTPEDFMGEWVDLDGTCRIEIAEHMAEESVDGYVVNVHMPVIAEESYSYVTWAYGCVWDDETQTLKSISRVTGKGDYEPDSEEEITTMKTKPQTTDCSLCAPLAGAKHTCPPRPRPLKAFGSAIGRPSPCIGKKKASRC